MQMQYRHKQALLHRVKQALMKRWQWPRHPNVESQRFFSSTSDAPNNLDIKKLSESLYLKKVEWDEREDFY
jgi:hypothetical protein